jgi:hypothetical protein
MGGPSLSPDEYAVPLMIGRLEDHESSPACLLTKQSSAMPVFSVSHLTFALTSFFGRSLL